MKKLYNTTQKYKIIELRDNFIYSYNIRDKFVLFDYHVELEKELRDLTKKSRLCKL